MIWTMLLFFSLQEMLAIMTSIYDMMGRYTLPSVRDDSPFEHVEKFFQVLLRDVCFHQRVASYHCAN